MQVTRTCSSITSDGAEAHVSGIALIPTSVNLLMSEYSQPEHRAPKEITMKVERVNCSELSVSQMPDGSRIVRNTEDATVLALNATAAAAWDACSSASTVAEVAEEMRRSFNPNVTEELAEASLLELQNKKLVSITGSGFKATRREVLAGLSAVALPLVVSLTIGEQKAHADEANSGDHNRRQTPRAHVPKGHQRPF